MLERSCPRIGCTSGRTSAPLWSKRDWEAAVHTADPYRALTVGQPHLRFLAMLQLFAFPS